MAHLPHICPQCGSDKIRSGSLHAHDGIRRLLLHTPLRCRDCRHRFWIFNPLKPVLLLATVGVLVAITAWFAIDPSDTMTAAQEPISVPHARAEKGDAEAQLQLGMRYAEGDGVIQNDKEAARWFALAAQQGLPEAHESPSSPYVVQVPSAPPETLRWQYMPTRQSGSASHRSSTSPGIRQWRGQVPPVQTPSVHSLWEPPKHAPPSNAAGAVTDPQGSGTCCQFAQDCSVQAC